MYYVFSFLHADIKPAAIKSKQLTHFRNGTPVYKVELSYDENPKVHHFQVVATPVPCQKESDKVIVTMDPSSSPSTELTTLKQATTYSLTTETYFEGSENIPLKSRQDVEINTPEYKDGMYLLYINALYRCFVIIQ